MGEFTILKKEELDKLSYDEFMKYRSLSAQKGNFRYFDELTLYMDIRFSEKHFQDYERWQRLSTLDEMVEPNEYGVYVDEITKTGHTELELSSYKLLSMTINGFGRENWYQRQIDSEKNKLGKSEYDLYDHNVVVTDVLILIDKLYKTILIDKLFKTDESS